MVQRKRIKTKRETVFQREFREDPRYWVEVMIAPKKLIALLD